MDPASGRTIQDLSDIPGLHIQTNVPLSGHTRFGIGGAADLFVETKLEAAFLSALRVIRHSGIPCVIVGAGSNLIVSDAGYRGVVLKFSGGTMEELPGSKVHVQAGAVLQSLVDFTTAHGLQGMETMTGIPGFTGAAIYGNAGAYGHSMHEIVDSVRFFDGNAVRKITNSEVEFRYRESIFKRHKDWIILSAVLQLRPGDAAAPGV